MFKCLYGKILKIKEKFKLNPFGYILVIDCLFIVIYMLSWGMSFFTLAFSSFYLDTEKFDFIVRGLILSFFSIGVILFLPEIFNLFNEDKIGS